MLTHSQIWSAVDLLAARYDLSASSLAKKAGLDPTTFNRSKRISADGHMRWPSTESISKILNATGASLAEFMELINVKSNNKPRALPLIGFAQAGNGGFFDDGGFPVGSGWDEVEFPSHSDQNAYALEVSGDSMQPLYREGDIIIVSPNTPARRGDRVVVKTVEGEILAKELKRQTAKTIELFSLNPEYPVRILKTEEVAWIARILWTSQ